MQTLTHLQRATKRYGSPTVAGCNANRVPVTCPFCQAATHTDGPHVANHREHLGYTICPAGGRTLKEAANLAASLLDNYLLPNESGYSAD